jgi:hypothetical protein
LPLPDKLEKASWRLTLCFQSGPLRAAKQIVFFGVHVLNLFSDIETKKTFGAWHAYSISYD